MNKTTFIPVIFLTLLIGCSPAHKRLTGYVNPFFGTATLWDSTELGYKPTHRAWGAEVFPGASLPNAMVQVTPVTLFGSGSGYQYEDTVIFAFFHTSMGHWNLGHVPLLPFTGEITADNYHSGYSHTNESASPGYYQVFLERYNINAEMTSTLRCAYHKFTYRSGDDKKLLLNLSRTNNRRAGTVGNIKRVSENTISGSQGTGEIIYFYAVVNHTIKSIDSISHDRERITIINFDDQKGPLELKIGFSFVSEEKAKKNLEAEMLHKNFAQVRNEADLTWEELLSKIRVTGGTAKQKGIFYSCLYRSFMWPALRSDVDGEFSDPRRNIVNRGFHYYTTPALWDDYRNKLVLMAMLSPEVTNDVISSLIEKAKFSGFMPIYFHGDHASPFITGSYLRGLRGFDVDSAYYYMLRNATVEDRRARLYLDEYIENGWIAENDVKNPTFRTEVDEAKAAVTKTLEYAYDDYSVALLAKELGDMDNYTVLMQRSGNYKNLFNPANGFMQGRLANGDWWEPFDPTYPYYVFMYREANAWQSTFFAPHDPNGFVALYPGKKALEEKLDSMLIIPWGGMEVYNLTTFIGQYCPGNQPSQGIPYMYYFVDKQEKGQALIDTIMNHYYAMGKEGLAYAGMDDSGGLSAWYVFNAIGLYTFSPADPEYIITVPVFDKVVLSLGDTPITIRKENTGRKITDITYNGQKIDGYFISHDDLKKGGELVIKTNKPFKIEGNKDVYMLTYFRQRYPTRIEIDPEGKIIEVPLPDPMLEARLHIALSTDGRNWTALNDNKPVWEQQMRDPFVRRDAEGTWRILATGGGRGGDRERVGPRCLYVTSKDLINWQVEEPLPLMKDVRNEEGALARNIWAPEWFYDEKTNEYMLFWSSSFKDAGWKESRLWYCKTRDWKTFTPAKPLFEPPYSVIDGSLLEHNGTYYLFHKEEEFGAMTGERRAIRLAISTKLEGPYEIIEGPLNQGQIVPVITEGPTVAKDPVKPGWLLYYDYCMTNRYGLSYSRDLINWTIEEDVSFPPDARHGCVSIITPEVAKKLMEVYSGNN